MQAVQLEHTRSDVALGVVLWYVTPAEQVVNAVHTRLEVAVGAVDWYSAEVHVRRVAQTRFDDDVAGTVSNCVALQTVRLAQTRLAN